MSVFSALGPLGIAGAALSIGGSLATMFEGVSNARADQKEAVEVEKLEGKQTQEELDRDQLRILQESEAVGGRQTLGFSAANVEGGIGSVAEISRETLTTRRKDLEARLKTAERQAQSSALKRRARVRAAASRGTSSFFGGLANIGRTFGSLATRST